MRPLSASPQTTRGPVIATLLALAAVLLPAGLGSPAAADQADSAQRRVAAASLAAGGDFVCALTRAGRVRCWGGGWAGQLGHANTDSIGDDETPASAGDVRLGGRATAIAAGYEHACAVLSTGRVRCWGYGSEGRLGYGNTDNVGDDETPAAAGNVPLGGRATGITAGEQHTCALLSTGRVRCWGYGGDGQLGYGNDDDIGDDETPASAGNVPLGGRAVAVSAGDFHTCALLTAGRVRCWGHPWNGELGYGNTEYIGDDETPASAGDVRVGGRVVAISAGDFHTCAVLASGSLRCWGDGYAGRLGYGNTDDIGNDETPASAGNVPVGGGRVIGVSAGYEHTCVVLASGNVRCWGDGYDGKLGYGDITDLGDDETPASAGNVPLGGRAAAISAGESHTCAVLTTGRLRCWGNGTYGRLGHGNTDDIGDDETVRAGGDVPLGARVRVKASPRMAMKAGPRKDRTKPYKYRVRGRLKGAFIRDAATCTGRVRVVVRAKPGGRKVKRTTTSLRPDCSFKTRVMVRNAKLGDLRDRSRVKLRIKATYLGNGSLHRAAKKRTVYRIRR